MKTLKYKKNQIRFFKNSNYLQGGETLQERIDAIVGVVEKYEYLYSDGLAKRVKYLIENQILIPSTPIWSNLGREEKDDSKSHPLPCSCNVVTVGDSIQDIYYAYGELAMLSKLGAGVGTDWTLVSETGTELEEGFYTNDKLDWIEDGVRVTRKVSQNSVRRGYSVPFISIMDKSFYDLMDRASKLNSDSRDPLVANNIGITLPSGFWEDIKTDKELQKRFLQVIEQRMEKGKIYILDIDNCNINQSPVYKKLGHQVTTSNICQEVTTPSYTDKTFACILSSLNLIHWDKIESDPQIIKDAYMFLDIIVEEYIRLTEGVPFMEKARKSAMEKRDIGLGTLGLHELFQVKGFAFGDMGSRVLNNKIYSTIREIGEEVTKDLGERLGSPKLCKEAGLTRRNVSLMMIAPNKSTSFLAGETSMGIEPYISNYFVHDLKGIHSTFKNPHLRKVLKKLGKDTVETWESISKNGGSVQHLKFLTEEQKDVFKTAVEISPKDLLDLASDRQKYIDMAQSLNLFNRGHYTLKDVYDIHKYAFSKGIKTLYYFFPSGHAAIDKSSTMAWDDCVACAD